MRLGSVEGGGVKEKKLREEVACTTRSREFEEMLHGKGFRKTEHRLSEAWCGCAWRGTARPDELHQVCERREGERRRGNKFAKQEGGRSTMAICVHACWYWAAVGHAGWGLGWVVAVPAMPARAARLAFD